MPGTLLAGRYRIVARVGRGGMGEVYRADDLKLGQPVAIKVLPEHLAGDVSRRERLALEARAAAGDRRHAAAEQRRPTRR